MGGQENALEREVLLNRIHAGFPLAEEFEELCLKENKLLSAKGMGWLIYGFMFFFVTPLIGAYIHYGTGSGFFIIHLAGLFFGLPKAYGRLYSKLFNTKKLRGIYDRLDELERQFTETTGIYYEYITVYCLEKIERYIHSGRADNLKEAYNLLEVDLHRDDLLTLQKEQHEEMLKKLRDIKSEVSSVRSSID
ncbi:hypothetical protein NQ095_19080 [Rossellomorea sp. SC111]|uniref:hypothetical protein n=1 Tax=Rossellomorea sp. SC111 TaxID=2968985 RepID=UPI00215A1F29|nr:hypothetical protein [Rossellomorea sp. SC111]MCR8850527.1 hypothetical protein [Rossellomorea sp. SC111]